jgi:hypothetical protein
VVKVSIEVQNGVAHFGVAVRARSIRRAASIVAGRYPVGDVRLEFPIDPKVFFVNDPAARTRTVEGFEPPQRMAA